MMPRYDFVRHFQAKVDHLPRAKVLDTEYCLTT
jgi:hypothetical protein